MNLISKIYILLWFCFLSCTANNSNRIKIKNDQLVFNKNGNEYIFEPSFVIIYSGNDPNLALRPAEIENVPYNIPTWEVYKNKSGDLKSTQKNDSYVGDGFDDSILEGTTDKRSTDPLKAGETIKIKSNSIKSKGDTIHLNFEDHEFFNFKASILTNERFPKLVFDLKAKKEGFYSIGYTGAPSVPEEEVHEIWQPLIWHEKRLPKNPMMTLAFRATLPLTMVNDGKNTIGIMASPQELPFDPLPLLNNSRFGIMLDQDQGQVQSRIFAPVPGGAGSSMDPGDNFHFETLLVVEDETIPTTYQNLAVGIFEFGDYRQNEISSLNQTFENIIDYSMSDYASFVDSLKGYAYSTDVPGAVKNVSSLHPLEIAIVADDELMFEKRAYPTLEYMLSREKFLFSLDPQQRIQHPSRSLEGPIAPVSELTSLYRILGEQNGFLIDLAENEYSSSRVRNLDVSEQGSTWVNAMHLFKATGDENYLDKAKYGADDYIESRINNKQTDFDDPDAGGFFFWNAFTPKWVELMELFEITEDKKYLDAALIGARYFTMYCWMAPQIPNKDITVNKGGKAPLYWYLKGKGHEQMYFPEEEVEAWRLSEIGLTPESSGTSSGHRAIFMANYAPWLLRLGYYTGDNFLKDVAKSAIIGRYRNFPGYHINTARTTAYEKDDYPLRPHKELSVNSFHYNHILPMASMLLDYMVTDVFVRSGGKIDFPSEYIEGYAYLQNKFYGGKPGKFYEEGGFQLWMPKNLLEIDDIELNYISGYKDNKLFIALTNQSGKPVNATVTINKNLVESNELKIAYWHDNVKGAYSNADKLSFNVQVSANGITAVMIEGATAKTTLQKQLLSFKNISNQSFQELDYGNATAMIINLGSYEDRAYIYLKEDDSVFSKVNLLYNDDRGNEMEISDNYYPFEFTVPLLKNKRGFSFLIEGIDLNGNHTTSKEYHLGF